MISKKKEHFGDVELLIYLILFWVLFILLLFILPMYAQVYLFNRGCQGGLLIIGLIVTLVWYFYVTYRVRKRKEESKNKRK